MFYKIIRNEYHSTTVWFYAKKSISNAILGFPKEIIKDLESGDFCLASFIDPGKAFHCLSQEILLSKLADYGFHHSYLFIESYLFNRQQYIQLDPNRSGTLSINPGVRQVSILGPFLFFILEKQNYSV